MTDRLPRHPAFQIGKHLRAIKQPRSLVASLFPRVFERRHINAMDKATEIIESIKNVTLGGSALAEPGPAESKPRGEKKAKKAKAPVDATPLEVIRLLLV